MRPPLWWLSARAGNTFYEWHAVTDWKLGRLRRLGELPRTANILPHDPGLVNLCQLVFGGSSGTQSNSLLQGVSYLLALRTRTRISNTTVLHVHERGE